MVPQASIYLCENTQADPERYDDRIHQAVLWRLKRAIEWHGNRLIRGGRMLPKRMVKEFEMQKPLKSILFAVLMNFGSRQESLTAEIRNFIIRQNGNCNKQRNSHPRTAR